MGVIITVMSQRIRGASGPADAAPWQVQVEEVTLEGNRATVANQGLEWITPFRNLRCAHRGADRHLYRRRALIVISPADLAAIEAQASAAAPNEACGLLEGTTGADGFAVTSVHPSDNLAWKPTEMFEVDPRLLLRLQRELRGGPTQMIGIYHSHPHGPPAPSATDLAMAWQLELVWVITALDPTPNPALFKLSVDHSSPWNFRWLSRWIFAATTLRAWRQKSWRRLAKSMPDRPRPTAMTKPQPV